MPVIVTGTFILPDGEVAADRVITIRRANRGVVQQSGQVVLPDDVVIETDSTGQVLFDLMPGNYVGFARTEGGLSASFTMAVPDVETIDVAAVINAADIPEGAAVGPRGPAGASAYDVAVGDGFVGTEDEWLDSLIGPAGEDGAAGANGLSAYQVAVANGFVGTQSQWLASLVGLPGDDGTDGADGLSAYEVALANGFVGSESAWLASLVGADGEDGVDGGQGIQGIQGAVGPTYNYRGESSALLNQSLAVLDTFTHTLSVSGRGTALLLKPKVARTLTSASIVDLTAIFTNYDVMLLSQDGVAGTNGTNGTNATITTVNTQAAYDAATPTATQLIVRTA